MGQARVGTDEGEDAELAGRRLAGDAVGKLNEDGDLGPTQVVADEPRQEVEVDVVRVYQRGPFHDATLGFGGNTLYAGRTIGTMAGPVQEALGDR